MHTDPPDRPPGGAPVATLDPPWHALERPAPHAEWGGAVPPTGTDGGSGDGGSAGGRRRRGRLPRALVAATLAGVLALGSGVAGAYAETRLSPSTTVSASTVVPAATASGGSTSTSPSGSLASTAATVKPSVVSITVRTASGEEEGSGVILRADGVILTNNHVVADASGSDSITVKLSDGRTATASVVGTDPTTDLAVIKANGVSGLKAATLGDSDSLQVGDTVLAVGSPLGLDGSVTSGIVSALHRNVTATITDAVQTDAAINPGNSGGPLVNSSGRVVGIDTAIASLGGSGSIGVGFAIPINKAVQVATQLIDSG